MNKLKPRVLISLVGGRPLPNVLVAIHLQPHKIYFIVSKDSEKDYQTTIKALPEGLIYDHRVVDPYQMKETFKQCLEVAQPHLHQEIILHITSGTKPMALGAYDCAKQLNSQNNSIDLCYLNRNELQWIFRSKEPESVSIGIDEYFKSYTWNVKYKLENKKLEQFALLLKDNISCIHQLLRKIRSGQMNGQTIFLNKKDPLSIPERKLLQKIKGLGIISQITDNSLTVNSLQYREILCRGDWLEYLVYHSAVELNLLDQCAWGVEDSQGKGEIDFVGIVGGQLIIASCKTETKLSRDVFEDLHSKAEQLGKGMCSTLMVTTIPKNSRGQDRLNIFEIWAKERNIILVMGEDIPQLDKIIKKVIAGKSSDEPEHIPIYARI